MKNFILILLLTYVAGVKAQVHEETRLALMQGIWDCSAIDETRIFKIVKGKNSLEFTYESSDNLDFALFDMVIGFQNSVTEYNDIELIHIDSLKENGSIFTEVINRKYIEQDGTVDKAFCIIPSYYECDESILSINGGKLFEYEKISKLPIEALKKLYYRGKKDKRNYIKDYLGIEVVEIATPKSIVYSSPDKPTAMHLSKGDVVTVLEEKGTWLNVDYGGDALGWIKKNDVK